MDLFISWILLNYYCYSYCSYYFHKKQDLLGIICPKIALKRTIVPVKNVTHFSVSSLLILTCGREENSRLLTLWNNSLFLSHLKRERKNSLKAEKTSEAHHGFLGHPVASSSSVIAEGISVSRKQNLLHTAVLSAQIYCIDSVQISNVLPRARVRKSHCKRNGTSA